MNDKNKPYRPDITNYDFVWGSDQDEYVKEENPQAASSVQEHAEEQEQLNDE